MYNTACIGPIPVAVRSKGAHTRTSLARESGSARVPMSQTRPCMGRHEPGLAEPSEARQGLPWDSARRRLAIGSYVCGRSRARLAYLHATRTDSVSCDTMEETCRLPCVTKHS